MVTPDIAHVSSSLAVMGRPFQVNLLVMFLTLGLNVLPIDEVEVEPLLVVAAMIGRAQAQGFMENGECAVKPSFPVPIRFGR